MYLGMVQKYDKKEYVSFRRIGHYSSVEEVLTTCQDILGVSREVFKNRIKNSPIHPVVAFTLCQYVGCTQQEAAGVLGVSNGTVVSIQLKKLYCHLKTDKALQVTLEQLKQRFTSKRW